MIIIHAQPSKTALDLIMVFVMQEYFLFSASK